MTRAAGPRPSRRAGSTRHAGHPAGSTAGSARDGAEARSGEWRLIETRARPGAENMAIDQALLESVAAGGRPVLRFYRWAPACLSLGRNQPVARTAVEAATRARGFDVVRRPTGGAGVLHDRELTYAVAVPVGAVGSPRETYLAINRALVAGLRRLGVSAETAGTATSVGADRNGPCFRAAAPGEVVAAGRKLVGSAQRRERRTLLQHGSLLLSGDQGVTADVFPVPGAVGDAGAVGFTTLSTLLGAAPSWTRLTAALCAGFEEVLGIRFAPATLSRGEAVRARALVSHFGSAAWTWRQ